MPDSMRKAVLAITGMGIAAVAWHLFAVRAGGADAGLPTIPEVLSGATDILGQGAFWRAVADTLWLWLIGMAAVIVIAVPLGVLIGSSPTLRLYTASTIDFFRSVPGVALLPIALVLLGTSHLMVTFMVLFSALWPLLIQTISGIDSVDPVTLDSSAVMHLSWSERFWHILLPGAMPYVTTGLRISASLALILVVVSGMLAGTPGLGLSLVQAEEGFQVAELYVYVIACGVLGLVINAAFRGLETRTLKWQTVGA